MYDLIERNNVISTIKSYISLYILLSCWFALPPMLLDKTLYPVKEVYNFFNLFTNKQLAQIDCCIIVNCWIVDLRYHQCFWIRTRLAFERSVQLLLTFTNKQLAQVDCCIRFIVNGWVFVHLHYHQCCWIRPGLPFEWTALYFF